MIEARKGRAGRDVAPGVDLHFIMAGLVASQGKLARTATVFCEVRFDRILRLQNSDSDLEPLSTNL